MRHLAWQPWSNAPIVQPLVVPDFRQHYTIKLICYYYGSIQSETPPICVVFNSVHLNWNVTREQPQRSEAGPLNRVSHEKGTTSTFKMKYPLVKRVHLHKANMYGSFCTSRYKQEKKAVGEKTNINSKHRLLIYKFTKSAISVLYKNIIHICCWSVLDKSGRKSQRFCTVILIQWFEYRKWMTFFYEGQWYSGLYIRLTSERFLVWFPVGDANPFGAVSGRASGVKIYQTEYVELPAMATPCE